MAEDAGTISARIELGIADLKRQIVEATTSLKTIETELGKTGAEAGKAGKKLKDSMQVPKTPFQSFFSGLKTGFKETGKGAEDAGKKLSTAFGPVGIVIAAVTAAMGFLTAAFKRVGEGNSLNAAKQDAENVNLVLNTMKSILDGIARGAEFIIGLFGKLAQKVAGLSDEEVVLRNRQTAVTDAVNATTRAQKDYNDLVDKNNKKISDGIKSRQQANQEEKASLEALIEEQTKLYEAYNNQADALKARNDRERELSGTRVNNYTEEQIAAHLAIARNIGDNVAVTEAGLRAVHTVNQAMLDEERAAYDNAARKAGEIRTLREKSTELGAADNKQLTQMEQIYKNMEAAIAANAVALEAVDIKLNDGAIDEKEAAAERQRLNNAHYETLTQYAALANKTALDAKNAAADQAAQQAILQEQKDAEYKATEETAKQLTAMEKIYKDIETALAASAVAEEELNIKIADGVYGVYAEKEAEAERLKIANERYEALTRYAALAKKTALDESKTASDQALLEDILAQQQAETFTQTENEAKALTDVEKALKAQAQTLAVITYEEGEGVKNSADANKARKAALEASLQTLQEIVKKENEAGGASLDSLAALEDTRGALEEVNRELDEAGKQTMSFEEKFNLAVSTITQGSAMIGDAIVDGIGEAVQEAKDKITETHEELVQDIENTFTLLMKTLAEERQRALEEAGLAQAETEIGLAEAMEAAIASGDDMIIYREKQRQQELAINKEFDAKEKAAQEKRDAEIEAADKQLKKDLAEEDYKLAVATWTNQLIQAIINTAAAITTNLAAVSMPAGGILAGAASALGATQIGIILANPPKPPAFKLGVVVGLPETWGNPWSGTAAEGRPVSSYQNGGMVGGGIAGLDAQPVIVSSREMILTEADQVNLLEMIRGGRAGEIQVVINNYVNGLLVSSAKQVVDTLNSGLGGKIDNRIIAR